MSAVIRDVVVIGGGAAGLAAARSAVRSGLSVVLVEQLVFGGLITNINELDGDIAGNGCEYASGFAGEAMDAGVESVPAAASAVVRDGDVFKVVTDSGETLARSVIIASGAKLRALGVPGEKEFEHRGVSHCADCDGPMLARQAVVVVGGGDSALQEALVLAGYAERVHLIHRRAGFRARPHLVEAVRNHPRISLALDTVVEAIEGDDSVQRVRTRRVDTSEPGELACRGFFAYVGLDPAAEFAPSEIERDSRGALVTDADLQTRVEGIFAAGAVRSGCGGMLSDAIADGEAAARAAIRHCESVRAT